MNKSKETWEQELNNWELNNCFKGTVCRLYSAGYVCGQCEGIPFDMERPINCVRNKNKSTKWNYEVRQRRVKIG
jgi:hypothetical protein